MTATKWPTADRDWNAAPLRELIEYIVAAHHDFLRAELPALSRTITNISSLLSQRHPALISRLHRAFSQLAEEAQGHMKKEEAVLFPAIVRLEEAAVAHQALPKAAFGSMRNPILMMEQDHQRCMAMVREIRSLTGEYQLNDRDCEMFRFLCQGLHALETDLVSHIELENRVLFPRAMRLEAELSGERR